LNKVSDISPNPPARKQRPWGTIALVLGVLLAIAVAIAGINLVLTSSEFQQKPTPAPSPTRVEVEAPTPAPTVVPDVVRAEAPPLRLEIPTANGFDSDKLDIPANQTERIMQWTAQDNRDHDGQLFPPEPASTSLVWDSTVEGGGQFGTDAQTSGLIVGHTTPYNREKLGVFQGLRLVAPGDYAAITTVNGRLCYKVTLVDTSIRKDSYRMVDGKRLYEVDEKYRYAPPRPGIIYLVACYRLDDGNNGPTTNNIVVVLELDQSVTNAGSC